MEKNLNKTELWWESLYDEHLADLLLVRLDNRELEATIEFLVKQLKLKPGCRVFDQCCGIGSLSLPLTKRKVEVIGVDQCEGYINRARQEARASRLHTEFHIADAFEFVPSRSCNAAFNWWTSFGYSKDDLQNLQMLKRAYESLVPGGYFALDFLNLAGIFHSFQPNVITKRETPKGEVVLLRESALDLKVGMIKKRWTYFLPDGQRVVHNTSLRFYLPHKLVELLTQCGFVDIKLFGSVHGEALKLASPRCICLARRPL